MCPPRHYPCAKSATSLSTPILPRVRRKNSISTVCLLNLLIDGSTSKSLPNLTLLAETGLARQYSCSMRCVWSCSTSTCRCCFRFSTSGLKRTKALRQVYSVWSSLNWLILVTISHNSVISSHSSSCWFRGVKESLNSCSLSRCTAHCAKERMKSCDQELSSS